MDCHVANAPRNDAESKKSVIASPAKSRAKQSRDNTFFNVSISPDTSARKRGSISLLILLDSRVLRLRGDGNDNLLLFFNFEGVSKDYALSLGKFMKNYLFLNRDLRPKNANVPLCRTKHSLPKMTPSFKRGGDHVYDEG